MGNTLITLAEGISSWVELETGIASLPSEQERGATFEEFCKAFFSMRKDYHVNRKLSIKKIRQKIVDYRGRIYILPERHNFLK